MALRAGSFGLRAARTTQCRSFSHIVLGKDTNQALGLGHYAIDMLSGKYGDDIDASVYKVVEQLRPVL